MRASTRPSASFFALVLLCFGSVLMMIAERPDLRPHPAERQVTASLGQGSAAVGAGILGVRAALYARRQARERGEARPSPAEVEAAQEGAAAGDQPRRG